MRIHPLKNYIALDRPFRMIILVCITLNLMLFSCSKPAKPEKADSGTEAAELPGDLYLFSSDEEYVLRVSEPVRFSGDLSLKEVLNQLGKHLETGYFLETSGGEKTNIRFHVEEVHIVNTPGRSLRIGIVNMIDETETAKTQFFQGSSGGRDTFCIIAATFLQPQNAVPLLDGLILLYNGKTFPEMVHIDFSGIVTPKYIRPLVLQVVNRAKADG